MKGYLRSTVAVAALAAVACGTDPGTTATLSAGPAAGSIQLTLDGLQPGWLVTTARLTDSAAAAEATVRSDGSRLSLTGTATDIFFAAVTDAAGQVVETHALGSPCSLARGRHLHVPADFGTIQAAVDAAKPGNTVAVAPGTFTEFVKLGPGVCLVGSGAGRSILDAQGAGQTLVDLTGAPGSAVLGFTLRGVGPPAMGCQLNQDPFACSGNWYAAAVYAGGMAWRDPLQDAPPLIANNVFEGNDIALMLYWRSTSIVRDNIFAGNRFGLVANHFQSRALVANNVFWRNSEIAIASQAADLDIVENIIARSAVGISFQYIQTGWIRCNLFYADTALQQDDPPGPPRFQIGVDGNIELDPLFTDPDHADFHLRPGSPAVDSGCFRDKAFEADGGPEDIGGYGGPMGSWSLPQD